MVLSIVEESKAEQRLGSSRLGCEWGGKEGHGRPCWDDGQGAGIWQSKWGNKPLRLATRQKCLLSLSSFGIALEVLARANGQEKEINGIQTGEGEIKLSLITDDMILYIENPSDSTKYLLELISKFSSYTRSTDKMNGASIHQQWTIRKGN